MTTGQSYRGERSARGPGGPGPHGSAWRVLGRMLWFFRYHPALLALVAMVSVASAGLELVPPWMIRLVLDRAAAGGTTGFIVAAGAVLMGFSLVHGATDFARLYLSAHLGQRTVFRIRTELFAHLSRLSFSFYDSARTGDLVSRVTADVDTVSEFFGRSAVIIATNVLFLAGVLAVVASWSPRLALVYVALLPFIGIAILAYAKRVRPAMGAVRRNLAGLTAHLDSTLAGIRVVKSLGREEHEMRRFAEESGRYREATIGATRITAFWMPVVNVIIAVGTAAVLWGGGYGVMQGSISAGMLVGFTVYVGLLMRPIRQTGMMVGMTMRALAAAEPGVAGMRVSQSLKREAADVEQFEGLSLQNLQANLRTSFFFAMLFPLMSVTNMLSTVLVLACGSVLLTQGTVTWAFSTRSSGTSTASSARCAR
ncbi:MAG: ABC transporter ATP-binding protein [Spirochaetota bacterium]